jgi:hypothetical protein
MIFRCSSLGKLMTNPRKKTETLSETAKSYIKQLAKENYYNYKTTIETKQMRKGIDFEHQSIELLNTVMLTNLKKNETRETRGHLTGECDLIINDTIIDIKTSWSLETFPAFEEDADDKGYEWQLRGYMHLYDKPKAKLIYCMIDTPNELLTEWDNLSIHRVSHIEPEKRITMVEYERDDVLEDMMKERLHHASELYAQYINQLNNK